MDPKAILAIGVGYGAGVWFSFGALRKAAMLNRALRWLPVQGRILESTLCKHPTADATHFLVRYEFTVGERIEGCTPRIAGDWFWNRKQQADFVARYTAGQQVEVYYDARDPRQNCLDRTDRSGLSVMWIIATGGFALASLLVWMLFG